MKQIKILGMIVLCLIVIPLINSQEDIIFTINKQIDFKIPCSTNGAKCSDSTTCELNIRYPNGSYMVNNNSMTNLGNGEFNITIFGTRIDTRGEHPYSTFCKDGLLNGTDNGIILVTQTGNSLETSESIIYVIFLIAAIFAFLLCLYGAMVIPFRDTVSPETLNVVSVNDMKYIKIVCILFSYILLLFIFGITKSIMENYLFINGAFRVFNFLYQFMFAFVVPLIILSIVFIIIFLVDGQKTRNAIKRGVPLR